MVSRSMLTVEAMPLTYYLLAQHAEHPYKRTIDQRISSAGHGDCTTDLSHRQITYLHRQARALAYGLRYRKDYTQRYVGPSDSNSRPRIRRSILAPSRCAVQLAIECSSLGVVYIHRQPRLLDSIPSRKCSDLPRRRRGV